MMKRKLMTLVLCASMVTALFTGCGDSTGSGSSAADSSASESSAADNSASGSSSSAVSTASAGTAASDDSITIGCVVNTTGQMAAYEVPAANAIQMAVDEINDNGGVNGKQLNLELINAQSDASQNSTAMTKLIDDGAPIIIGECESTLAMTAGSVAQDAGVPFITYGATLPDLPDRVGDCFYMTCYSDKVQAYAMAEYAYNDLGAKTAYVIEDTTSEYTEALSKYFKEHFTELGGSVVLEDSYDENGYTDYSAEIAKVQALDAAPDVLYFASFSDQAPTMLSQFRSAGLSMPILSGDGFDAISIAEVAGKDANNVYYTTHIDVTSTDSNYTDFVKKYNDLYGTDPENAFASLGYDTVYFVKDVLESINGDITKDSIKEAIGQVKGFKGLTGAISFEDGSHVPNKQVVIQEFNDGGVEHVTTIQPE